MTEQPQDSEALRPDLNQIVSAFGMQALIACGKMMNPVSRKYETDLAMAHYHIGCSKSCRRRRPATPATRRSGSSRTSAPDAMAYLDASRGVARSARNKTPHPARVGEARVERRASGIAHAVSMITGFRRRRAEGRGLNRGPRSR